MHDPDRAISIPVLASLNVSETAAFYIEQLGFQAVFQADDYLLVRRDAIELHFWLTDNPNFPENTSCYIRGGQIAELHEEFSEASVPGLSAFELRPWGMKEFYISDPHGNLLRFGMEGNATS